MAISQKSADFLLNSRLADAAAGEMRLIAAARIGRTRLIDNMRVFLGTDKN